MNWFQCKSYLSYLVKSRHWKGFGIHSPFVFDFVANLMCEPYEYYEFQKIRAWRNALIRGNERIEVTDLGAGSHVSKSQTRKVSDIVRHGSISQKYGELLFRIICRVKPENIIELGTSTGISTLYMALPNKTSKITTIEGCENVAGIASHTFNQFDINNINLVNGPFNEKLPLVLDKYERVDFVFFDGDHREESTLRYFYLCLEKVQNDSVFVFDDIHWSEGMERAWNTIVAHPSVKVSIDLFRMGIVFFRNECPKSHYLVRF